MAEQHVGLEKKEFHHNAVITWSNVDILQLPDPTIAIQ